jgi:hypothetical protein
MKQRNKKIPGDKPQWIVMEEEAEYEEVCRKIRARLKGNMTPSREAVVEKMRKKYSKSAGSLQRLRKDHDGGGNEPGAGRRDRNRKV